MCTGLHQGFVRLSTLFRRPLDPWRRKRLGFDVCPSQFPVLKHPSEANWADLLLGKTLSYNIFTILPVEIIREIGNIPGYPDAVAALALCNKDLEYILEGFCDPVHTAYVAMCSLGIILIRRTLRKSGGRALRDDLTRSMNDMYALNSIVQNNCRDIFAIIEPYITYGDPSMRAAAISAVGDKYYTMVHRLIPYLSDAVIVEVFGMTCTTGNSSVVDILIYHLPTRLWERVCRLNLEFSVTSGRKNIVRVLTHGGANLNTIMVSEQHPIDQCTSPHWLGLYGLITDLVPH